MIPQSVRCHSCELEWSKRSQPVLCTSLVLRELLQYECKRIWFVTSSLKTRSWRPGPDPGAATTPVDPSSCVWSSATLALTAALVRFPYGGFSSLPSTYQGTTLDSFSVSDSIANKVFINFLSVACVGTVVLGVFLTNQAFKAPLTLLILSLFLLENIHQFIKNSASFQLFFLLVSLWSSLFHVGCHCWQHSHLSCYSPPPSL